MPRYTLPVLGGSIVIETQAGEERVELARQLLEQRFAGLNSDVPNVSKEKLLTVLALSLADDYLQCRQELERLEGKAAGIVEKIDGTNA